MMKFEDFLSAKHVKNCFTKVPLIQGAKFNSTIATHVPL